MKRMMRICCVMLLVAFLLPLTVQADVIYEPFDSFYMQHASECTYVARRYTAKGPNGTVTIYVSPSDPEVKKTYDNGTVLDVSYSYQAGDGAKYERALSSRNKFRYSIGVIPMQLLNCFLK